MATASAGAMPGLAAIVAATSVVSGLTTFDPGGAVSCPWNASPVDLSMPPTVRSVADGSPKSKLKLPSWSVVVQTSPSPGSHALFSLPSIQSRTRSLSASAKTFAPTRYPSATGACVNASLTFVTVIVNAFSVDSPPASVARTRIA